MNINQSPPTPKNKIQARYKLILFVIAFSMLPLFFATRTIIIGFTQTRTVNVSNEKEIKKLTFDNEPVELLALGNSQRAIKLSEKFTQDTDWLKEFNVKFKNKSAKAITYLKIDLDFPETKSSGNIMAFPLSYGHNPMFSLSNEKVEKVKAGEDVELILTEKKYEALKTFIETRHPLESLSKIDIRIVFILFDDETAWSAGNFLRPDPNDPKRYIPVASIEKEKTNEY
jgi:hypothetical protein